MNEALNAVAPAELVDVSSAGGLPRTMIWDAEGGALLLLDQTLLPQSVKYRRCTSAEHVWLAIRELCVRGAPAIGVAAAYGLCIGTRDSREASSADELLRRTRKVADYLVSSRPTAVNLEWAVRRVARVCAPADGNAAALWDAMLAETETIHREDVETCRKIGANGAHLIPEGGGVLTHCNAGALATAAHGTALSLMYNAHQAGRRFRVFADETRPLLQGARLTAFELAAAGIDVTVLCDGAAAALMQSGQIDLVVTGADRIAANGDTANKIGTYGIALLAKHHGIPFYVAAPISTFDASIASGASIPIEQRAADEVRCVRGSMVTGTDVACYNPAFDVTPAELIRGIVTEKGVLEPVTEPNIAKFL
jgi:methylthioribose-1-phosphate isomerase